MSAVASILLGLAFLVAGGSKLAAGPSWPRQAEGLGAPSVVVPLLPWFELVLGAVLGAWSATPLGWGHVARNAALAALGVVVLLAA